MRNERNFTSETYPWNNKHGLGQRLLKRHMQVVREPINSFTNIPQHLGHDRISFISDIQHRYNSDNSSFLRRFDYPLVNFFSLTNQQSQNWNKITSTKFSPSSKAILHRKQFFNQLGGKEETTLKNQYVTTSKKQNGVHEEEPTLENSKQIIVQKLHFNSGSKSDGTFNTDSGIPGTKAQNLVQAQFIEKQNPGIVGGGRISKTDTMSSGNNTNDQQPEAIFHKVQAYHDKPVEMSYQTIYGNLPRLTSLGRAIYRSYSKLSDNKYQSPGLAQQIDYRQHATVYRKRFEVAQMPENKLTKNLLRQRPETDAKIKGIDGISKEISRIKAQNEVQLYFFDQQKSLQVGEDFLDKSYSKPSDQIVQQKTPQTQLTSLNRAIYRNIAALSDNKYQNHGIGQQIHSKQHNSIFSLRLGAVQLPTSSTTKNGLWQKPVVGTKFTHIDDTNQGKSGTNAQNDIVPADLTPMNRAIYRNVVVLSDNKYHNHGFGQQIHSNQHTSIFRQRLDAVQLPTRSTTNNMLWQKPVSGAKTNRSDNINSSISFRSIKTPSPEGEGWNEGKFYAETFGIINTNNRKPTTNAQNDIAPAPLTPLNRAIYRNVVALSDNKLQSHGIGQQIHSNQPIAGTRVNRLIDTSQAVSVTNGQNQVQAQYRNQQLPKHTGDGHIYKTDGVSTIIRTIGQQHVPTSLKVQAYRHNIAKSDNQMTQTEILPFRLNFPDRPVINKRHDASIISDNTGAKIAPWFHSRPGIIIHRALSTNSHFTDVKEQNEDPVKYFENTEQTRINKVLKNNTPFSFIHRQLSPNLIRRLVSTHRFEQHSDKIARQHVRNDFPNQISPVSLPINLNGNSIDVQRANPTIIQKKSLLEFDSSSQLPLAGNFNIQRKTNQPVLQNEENSNILFRQDVTDQSPQSLITVTEANSATYDTKSDDPEAKQPSADELVDKVWRKLMRKLVVEQERIGGSAKWH